ncbi:MAG: pyridoxamine 5'-phosphate oxidase family protein [Candidatus Altiarchaeota archaeon]
MEKTIREYVESHNVCTIALSDGNSPNAHTVYYVSQGLNLYFESDPGSQKIHILKSNPKISVTINEDYRDWRKIKGIQLFGKAYLSDEKHAPSLQKLFLKKFPNLNEMGGIPEHHIFVEVVPEKIYFLDFEKNFGNKSVYYPNEKVSRVRWNDIGK